MGKPYSINRIPQEFTVRYFGGRGALRPVDGYPVTIKGFTDWEFFVYADEKNQFRLVEKSTGVSVSEKGHKSMERCVQVGREWLVKVGVEWFDRETRNIQDALNSGMSLIRKRPNR